MNGYTEFQVNAPEHLSQHIEVYFISVQYRIPWLTLKNILNQVCLKEKMFKKPFVHESLENPLSCVLKCASENFHTLLFGLISNQATTLLQFMMGWRAVCSCHQSVTHIVLFQWWSEIKSNIFILKVCSPYDTIQVNFNLQYTTNSRITRMWLIMNYIYKK